MVFKRERVKIKRRQNCMRLLNCTSVQNYIKILLNEDKFAQGDKIARRQF